MARRMLINALYPEECRIAVVEDDRLLDLEVERADHTQLKGNIYKASITRIEPSLQAAFLDIGSNRNGFLQINDIHSAYFQNWPPEDGSTPKVSIQDVLRPGQELVIQVVKDERALKGATLTTNLSIPGRFLVMMVGNQRGGVSRKIVDEAQRHRLRQAVQKLKLPPGMGVIVRTAGINRSHIELQRDLDGLLDIWHDILVKSMENGAPRVLYKESDLALRTIRDYLTPNIEEIVIDERETFERARQFVEKVVPNFVDKVRFYEKPQPLFSYYNLDSQVDQTGRPEVTLPSGGSIVINITEAVVAIDVNSGRSTSQSDVEETAFNTNKEAAETIAQQLRLRDLGGLIVIDFIDMNDKRHKQTVEKVLRDSIRIDKAKIEIGRISKFGLLELSRQRLKASLTSQSHSTCPHCDGRGRVKTPESAALEALRKIQSAVSAGGVEEIRVRMAPAAALLLLNSKRHLLTQFEQSSGTSILVYADGRMKPEEYELELRTQRNDEVHSATLSSNATPAPEGSQRDSRDRSRSSDGGSHRRGGGGAPHQGRDSRGDGRNDRRDRRQRNRRGRRRNPRGDRGGDFPRNSDAEGGSGESSNESSRENIQQEQGYQGAGSRHSERGNTDRERPVERRETAASANTGPESVAGDLPRRDLD